MPLSIPIAWYLSNSCTHQLVFDLLVPKKYLDVGKSLGFIPNSCD